ncbi:hypothetical protein FJ941_06115 [Mesorhizobium sp. B2-3-13]|uniref:hypothetical protein n=1 Tax=unclassified Mesorhizobium TaxID=325217 RepID=UPI00112A3794|nr:MULTISPECIES: hypothetical protein [unclassified Mesorhizobium]TPJ38138.1 hypothetical protein FJ432_23625 [Mesorhizobium sp. B2-6-5]TPK46715.1 hypothetical protein FJ560_18905 [Mesorhizobium sp. B2-5-5]TPL88462.1 hypothetical protein FJ941_06115 [Mesorhizobium sp. B2-3-13]TPL99141.1 hypothetical protein FJ960_21785 [Mesorhizobium sp. B2-3-11]
MAPHQQCLFRFHVFFWAAVRDRFGTAEPLSHAFCKRHLYSHSPQPPATPRPHGHLDIADRMNFPTGRTYRHVFGPAHPLDDRA